MSIRARRYNAPMRTRIFLLCFASLTCLSQTEGPPVRKPNGAPPADNQKDSTEQRYPGASKPTVQIHVNPTPENGDPDPKAAEELEINRHLEWLTGGLVFVGALQTLALIWQARVLRTHSRHMKQSVEQMTKAVDTYDKYVAVAESGLDLTRQSNEITKGATELTQKALVLTERADVVIESVTASDYPHFMSSSRIIVTFKNCGRTRAENIEITSRLFLIGTAIDNVAAPMTTALIGAGDTLAYALPPLRVWMAPEDFLKIARETAVLAFEIKLNCADVFGNPYTLSFTGFLDHAACQFRMGSPPTAT